MSWQVAYRGRDNAIRLQLLADQVAANLGSVTRWQLIMSADVTLDSDTDAAAFDATIGDGIVDLYIGRATPPPPAGNYTGCKLVSYSGNNPGGVVWTDGLAIRVKEGS